MGLRDLIGVVWARRWLLLIVVVLAVVAAVVFATIRPSVYEPKATLLYSPPIDPREPSAANTVTDTNTLTLQLQSVGNLLSSSEVRASVDQATGGQYRKLEYSVWANVVTPESSASSGSSLPDAVAVNVSASDAAAAAALANAYAEAVIKRRREVQQSSLRDAQKVLRDELDVVRRTQGARSAEYGTLALQLHNLQVVEATANGDFVFAVPASVPTDPAGPGLAKLALLGLLAGILLGGALIFVLSQLDVRVRDHRVIADLLDLPVIARVPRLPRALAEQRVLVSLVDPRGASAESYRVLRRNLEWSRIDGSLKSLMISSLAKDEGKTMSLCNLAVTLARAGNRVAVVDADLRDPMVHRVFRLANRVGLTSVALGRTKLTAALNEIRPGVKSYRPAAGGEQEQDGPRPVVETWSGTLAILTAGPIPPNPGEVAASRAVADVIATLRDEAFDYVLVDAPPLLVFGDAGALSSNVDGVMIAVNVAKARRPLLEEGRETIEKLPSRLVGVIVIGERAEETQLRGYAQYVSGV